jgi:hypothetical protein
MSIDRLDDRRVAIALGAMVRFLASDEAGYVTGATLEVNGGILRRWGVSTICACRDNSWPGQGKTITLTAPELDLLSANAKPWAISTSGTRWLTNRSAATRPLASRSSAIWYSGAPSQLE